MWGFWEPAYYDGNNIFQNKTLQTVVNSRSGPKVGKLRSTREDVKSPKSNRKIDNKLRLRTSIIIFIKNIFDTH